MHKQTYSALQTRGMHADETTLLYYITELKTTLGECRKQSVQTY